jgi:UDP-N-acetylglucosamine 1-carboxyvinyltransferase
MTEVIESLGAKTDFNDHTLTIDCKNLQSFSPDETAIKKIRGSVVVLGPLISRFNQATFSEPGGCLIGSRPIDTHIKAFKDLGVDVEVSAENSKYHLKANEQFRKDNIEVVLSEMSVTATENMIMAAVLKKGTTTIQVAASEPEITDLANFLIKAGAKITGAGTNKVVVTGVGELHPVEYTVIPDRIEVGTIIIAAAICGGEVTIKDIIPEHMSLVLSKLKEMSVDFTLIEQNNGFADVIINQKSQIVSPPSTKLDVRQYPGLPTDLQSPLAVLAVHAKGETQIFETLFDSRFEYTKWLVLMGAKIRILNPYLIKVTGPVRLKGTKIESSDIRGGAALVIAALAAEGTTTIDKIEFVDRGYENFEVRLEAIGADIERID